MERLYGLFATSNTYIQDSMPLPICKRVRASKNKKVQGKKYCGYCAAKNEKFFGFRLHMVVDFKGIPVSVCILPAAQHDLESIYETTYVLPENSKVFGDKGYTCQREEKALLELGITLMPLRRKNQKIQWDPKTNFLSKVTATRSRHHLAFYSMSWDSIISRLEHA
jgi:IS5 family transposase